jgi:hypothetical protein
MADSETSPSNTMPPEPDEDPVQASAELMRRQSRQHPRRRSSRRRTQSKRKKVLRRVLIILGQVAFLAMVIYTWYKVSTAIQ